MRFRRALIPAVLLVASCATIAPFNQRAYEQATSVKAQALMVIDGATEPFADHKAEVRDLRLAVERAYEYAKGRPKNELSTQQWEIIRDPKRKSLGGLLRRWEEKGVLPAELVADQKAEIAKHFDEVIGLEVGKVTPKQEQPAHADAR
jgi:hypothetical protein